MEKMLRIKSWYSQSRSPTVYENVLWWKSTFFSKLFNSFQIIMKVFLWVSICCWKKLHVIHSFDVTGKSIYWAVALSGETDFSFWNLLYRAKLMYIQNNDQKNSVFSASRWWDKRSYSTVCHFGYTSISLCTAGLFWIVWEIVLAEVICFGAESMMYSLSWKK